MAEEHGAVERLEGLLLRHLVHHQQHVLHEVFWESIAIAVCSAGTASVAGNVSGVRVNSTVVTTHTTSTVVTSHTTSTVVTTHIISTAGTTDSMAGSHALINPAHQALAEATREAA